MTSGDPFARLSHHVAKMHITKSNTEITSITLLFGGVTVTLPYFRYSLLKMRTPLRY